MFKLALTLCFVLVSACGSSPCARTTDSLKKFATKADKCASGAKLRSFAASVCENAITTCTAADTAKLEKYSKCLDAVAECNPADTTPFRNAADACEVTADEFRVSCPAGLGT